MTDYSFRVARDAGVRGTYTFQTSPPENAILPPRPAVHIAEAQTREEARRIHRKIWNLGNVPFLIVLLPNEIRVYTGFDFAARNEEQGLISIVNLAFDNIQDKLGDFKAESIDSGLLWKAKATYLVPEKRVDMHLLNNLEKLRERLKEEGLEEPSVAHALIGKYVYIRYLRDRKILSNEWLQENQIVLDEILGRNATLDKLCRLTSILEEQFNGSIFPFPSNFESVLNNSIVRLVASTFKGDDPTSGQLHLDFEPYDFSYIPVETLSAIYEQFLHTQGIGKEDGAIYTPEPLADYLLCELDHSKPLSRGMKVLDPCCGSGIFLVLTYRKLIEMELSKRVEQKLQPEELREILFESIYGVERNLEACYVTEFSLILTLLSYVEPPDLYANKDFKFPRLHNTRIFKCDFFNDKSEFWRQNKRFDWIIGNPPWIELKLGEELVKSWIEANKKERPVTGNRVCEAFSWRVTDLAKKDGYVGLLIHAKSLFNNNALQYREKFFKKNTVVKVTNFSSLRKVLFGGRAKAPTATIVYRAVEPIETDGSIVHYGPFVINQMSIKPWGSPFQKAGWSISINENEIQTIPYKEAEMGEALTWKSALWGTYRDKKAIKRLQKLFTSTLDEIREERGWFLCEGIQLRSRLEVNEEYLDPIPEFSGIKCFDIKLLNKTSHRFIVPDEVLKVVPEEELYVRKRGGKAGLNLVRAPHLVLNSSYAIYGEQDFIVPSGQIGLSAPVEDSEYLRAISIFRNSSIVQYYLFFISPQLGIDRGRITLKAFENLPIPKFSENQVKELSKLHEELARIENEQNFSSQTVSLQQLLDQEFERILRIPYNLSSLAKEFIEVKLSISEGKTTGVGMSMPSSDALYSYAETLRQELDHFTDGSGIHHKISVTYSKEFTVCIIEFVQSEESFQVAVQEKGELYSSFFTIYDRLKQRFSQWVYIRRSLRIFDVSKMYICKSSRLIDWTRTQALNDSDDIIAEILSVRHRNHEVVI